MKEGWEYIDFKDVFPIKMGKTPPRGDKSSWDEKKETHNKWVSIADISNNEGKIIKDTKEYISDSAAEKISKVSKGSLLMSFKLSIGRMAFAGDDLYTNEAIIAIPESNKYILRFMYYYLLSYNWLSLTEGNEKVKGATLNKSSIGRIQLPVLDFFEQQSIVDYLDSAFAKIDAMKANAEKALNEAKTLFQASLKEMLEPKEGWEEKTLKEIAQIKIGPFGSLLHKKDYITGGVPLVNPIHMVNGHIAIDNNYTIMESKAKELSLYRLKENDIVFARRGEIGRCALVGEKEDTYLCGTGSLFVRFNQVVDYGFMLLLFQSKYCKEYLEKQATGATMLNINSAIVGDMPIKYPHIHIQQSIVATLDSLKSKVDRLQANYEKISQECDTLKQAILRQVFE